MKVGDLRHRITIQKPTKTADGMGGFTETWADHATVWAAVWPLKGQTLLDAKKLETVISHRIVTRYISGVYPYWRISYDSRTFTIDSIVNPDERNRWLEFLCYEETGAS